MGVFGEFIYEGKAYRNTIIGQGASLMLRAIFRGEAVLPADYYIGLTNVNVAFSDAVALATAAGAEPSGHGYARQAAAQDTTDWTVEVVNGIYRARSKSVAFTASSDWATPWSRMFVCDASSGTTGNVFAISGPLSSPANVLNGAGPTVEYIFNIEG